MPPNSLFDASVAVTMKPENAITRKENCKPIFFKKHSRKSLNKILANQTQQHIKKDNIL